MWQRALAEVPLMKASCHPPAAAYWSGGRAEIIACSGAWPVRAVGRRPGTHDVSSWIIAGTTSSGRGGAAQRATTAAVPCTGQADAAAGSQFLRPCPKPRIRVDPPPDLLELPGPVRLDRLLSNLGICMRSDTKVFLKSRRLALRSVEESHGSAKKGGNAAKMKPLSVSSKVVPAAVLLDGQPLPWARPLHLMLHKPEGYVCSHDEPGQQSCFDLLPDEFTVRTPSINAVGRLDKMASGLLLLTQHGHLLHALTAPRRHLDKKYIVTIDAATSFDIENGSEAAACASAEISLRERSSGQMVPCKPADVEYISPTQALVTLREGRYHQLRRMMAALGHHVIGIHRVQLGPVELGTLAPGAWRPLTSDEVLELWAQAHSDDVGSQ